MVGAIAAAYVAKQAIDVLSPGIINNINGINSYPKLDYEIRSNSKIDTKVDPTILYPNELEVRKDCTTAIIKNGDVIRGNRLTLVESVDHINMGGNIICDNEKSAFMVSVFFPEYIGPEIDLNQKPGNVYYYHYHPDRNSHRHIWYYTTKLGG